ncbi:hypothetical protein D3C85_1281590 [compost metagenome]
MQEGELAAYAMDGQETALPDGDVFQFAEELRRIQFQTAAEHPGELPLGAEHRGGEHDHGALQPATHRHRLRHLRPQGVAGGTEVVLIGDIEA